MNLKGMILVLAMMLMASNIIADTLFVPGDYANIQLAVDASATGDVIEVAAGHYPGQVWVNGKDITINGAGVGLTFVEATETMTNHYGVSSQKYPVMYGGHTDNVTFSNLTVDGLGLANIYLANRFEGIGFEDGGATLTNVHVTNIQTTPFSGGSGNNIAIHGYAGDGIDRVFNFTDVLTDNFEKDGVLFWGPNVTANLLRVTVIGVGPTDIIGQNGIDFADGVTLNATDCVIKKINYTGATWTASGILPRWDTVSVFDGCVLTECQTSVYYSDGSGEFNNCTISSPIADAFYAYSSAGSKGDAGDRLLAWGADNNLESKASKSAITISIENSTFTGTGQADSWGVTPFAGGSGSVEFSMVDCQVSNWDVGVAFYDIDGATINATLRNNNIYNNTSLAIWDNTTTVQDIEQNYLGALDPTLLVNGISDFSPWYGYTVGSIPMTVGTNDAIQSAIDLANSGDTVNVMAGDYTEQLVVDGKSNLTINGAGVDATTIYAFDNMPAGYGVSSYKVPVIMVLESDGVDISNLKVDGLNKGITNRRFEGIGYSDAGGSVTNVYVTNIMDSPMSGVQDGFGVHAWAGYGTPRTFNMTDVTVDKFQKDGVLMWGEDLTGTLTRVTVVGEGPISVIGQNGIELAGLVAFDVVDCNVSLIDYTGATWTATGLLVEHEGTIGNFDGCQVTESQTSVYFVDASGEFNNGSVSSPIADALVSYKTGATKAGMDRLLPSGVEDEAVAGSSKAVATLELLNSTFTGSGSGYGPTVYSVGPFGFTMTGCEVTGWDYGVIVYDMGGADISATLHDNKIYDNAVGAYANTADYVDAINNWWGHASGPLDDSDDTATGGFYNPLGLGNAVSDQISYNPWTGMAGGSISPVTTGPLNCSQTITLTFNYTADAYTPDMFLYNAVVSATSGLNFGAVDDLLPFTDDNENFYAMSTGTNEWTVTGSTVGNPAHPVSGAGTTGLFTITFSATGDVIGDVVIESLTLRDPDNNNIPVILSGASITYDCTAPLAVTDINADPHHEKIGVSWNHDGTDVDHYEVFSGVWHDGAHASAYPEYDDLINNTTPARPADYPAMLADIAEEWEVVGSSAALTIDESWAGIGARGVYYYEVYAVDAAGNASPRAASNDRATNYWLGDMTENGQVAVLDMSTLGGAFGTTHSGGGGYLAIVDVGPTDDWSRVGIPTTDDSINFEDLMVFSMNFGIVQANNKSDIAISTKADLSWVRYDEGTYALRLNDASGLKGVHLRADLPEGASVTVTEGDLLDQQTEMTFLRNIGEDLDVSLAITGVDNGFMGQGDLFIVECTEELAMEDIVIDLRGSDNSRIEVSLDSEVGTLTPRVFGLNAAYPNPFNPMTKISFSLPESQDVRLNVYGIDGKLVTTLVNETRGAGLHEVIWNGQNNSGQVQASGLYFYRIEAGPYSQVRKMTLMK